MANTLTNLIPVAYRALDVVSRELTGLIGAVNLDAAAETIAKGQTIYSPVAPVNTSVADIAVGMAITSSGQTIGTKSLTLTDFKSVSFEWNAEEEFGVNTGARLENIMADQMAQCFRVHANAIELALCTAAKNGASRATGTTAGTAPVLADFANVKKILDDNGAPQADRHVILDTTGGASLRNTANLFQVYSSGDSAMLRQGVLGNLYGMDVRESAGVQPVTKGGMTGALINLGNLAVGSTVLTFDTGTVNTTGFVAGDIITIGADTNKYVVEVGSTATAGTITIAAPGLRVATVDNAAISVFGTSTRNIALSRNAITLATRLPKFQANDLAADRYVVTDPRTGIAFEITMWPGQRMVKYEVSIAYGMSVIKPEHLAVIIG